MNLCVRQIGGVDSMYNAYIDGGHVNVFVHGACEDFQLKSQEISSFASGFNYNKYS